MKNKYFLYIDILGFSNLVKNERHKVESLNKAIASLNVHGHYAFHTIVFSDTILVYNSINPSSIHEQKYLVMYLCEFVQDLMHRLIGYEIYFRAVITKGDFEHYKLNDIDFYFGNALNHTYKKEKELKYTGLFMNKNCPNDIFSKTEYDSEYNYVFVTQGLDALENFGVFPVLDTIAIETDELWVAGPEILFLKDIYSKFNSSLKDDIRKKYENTWNMYTSRYPKTTTYLVNNNFDLISVNPNFDWEELQQRYPEDYEWASKRKDV